MSLFPILPRERLSRRFFEVGLCCLGTCPLPAQVTPEPVERLAPFVVLGPSLTDPLRLEMDPRLPTQPVPARDGADTLRAFTGFSLIRKGGTDGDPVFRGLAGSRLGLLSDTQPALGGCGNRMDPPSAYLFPETYDRVRLVKGPQSLAYGSGFSAGLVRFERDSCLESAPGTHYRVSSTVGSFGRLDLAAELAHTGSGSGGRLFATSTRAEDYDDGAGRQVHGAYKRWSLQSRVDQKLGIQSQLSFQVGRSDGEAAYADRAMDGTAFERDFASVNYLWSPEEGALQKLEVSAHWAYVDHTMDNFSLRPFLPTAMMPAKALSNPDRKTLGARWLATLRTTRVQALRLGMDANANRHALRSTSNQEQIPFASLRRTRDAGFNQVGAFAELDVSTGQGQVLSTGLRLDQWQAKDHRLQAKMGTLGFGPNPSSQELRRRNLPSTFARLEQEFPRALGKAYLAAAYVQRFPDYWELFANESTESLSAFRARPERTLQFDTGCLLRTRLGDLSVAAFAARQEDFLLVQNGYVKTQGAGTRLALVTRNIEASTWGGELDFASKPFGRLSLQGGLAYVRGENRSEARPLGQMPPLEAKLGLHYGSRVCSLGVQGRHAFEQNRFAKGQGSIVGQDLGPSPSFTVLACHVSWTLAATCRLAAGVDNLLDKAYAEHLSRAGAAVSGYPQLTRVQEMGRFFWLRLDLSR